MDPSATSGTVEKVDLDEVIETFSEPTSSEEDGSTIELEVEEATESEDTELIDEEEILEPGKSTA